MRLSDRSGRASQRRGMTDPTTFSLALSNETATAHLMADLALADRPGRCHHAFRRPRRRQDRGGAGHDPLSRRRRRAGGSEPDLHAGANLRSAAISAASCGSLPHQRSRGTGRDRLVAIARGHGGADRMAGARAGALPAGPDRHRAEPSSGAGIDRPRRRNHRLRQSGRASRKTAKRCGSSSTPRAMPRRNASACRATPRPVPMRG